MPTVEKAKIEMFEDILPVLNGFNNPKMKREDWLNLFNYSWMDDEEYPGFVLIDNGKIVGFVSTIFAAREIEGKTERFCNISSWIVPDEYRKDSLNLLFPILKLKNYTLTNLTPSKQVSEIMGKLGFQFLDDSMLILLPSAGQFVPKRGIKTTAAKELLEAVLDASDLKIYRDHRKYKCLHLVTYTADNYCYIIFTSRTKKHVPFNQVHYISNIDFYTENIEAVKNGMFKANHIPLTLIDSRLLKGRSLPRTKLLKNLTTKYFRSSSLEREKIDNLYSEFILLNL